MSSSCSPGVAHTHALQRRRRAFQAGFFALFALAPAMNLLRFDLTEVQLWFLGQRWTLGIDAFRAGTITSTELALSLLLRGILPAVGLAVAFLAVAWHRGRLYCGWLCPHFSVVETLNAVMYRALGRFSLWDRHDEPTAVGAGDDSTRSRRTHDPATGDDSPRRRWWPVFALLSAGFAFLWAITLLTYLLPPARVWGHLLHGELTAGEARFLLAATTVFTLDFVFARHLFCRFGCAVGLFQSLAWMANPKAMVVGFARERGSDCRSCATAAAPAGNACDTVCPMRLRPRSVKRLMFSCTQCGRCLRECATAQQDDARGALLEWRVGVDALRESMRGRASSDGFALPSHAGSHGADDAPANRPASGGVVARAADRPAGRVLASAVAATRTAAPSPRRHEPEVA